ncbi:MAG: hypothetical protein ACRCWG_13730 [Sarcina sp.]
MYAKTNKKKLMELIEDDIVIYLLDGTLDINPYLKDLDLNISNLDKLLKIHFLLSEEVARYIKNIKNSIKKMNTSTYKESVMTHGNIKGNISWNKTLNKRNNTNIKDKTLFVCNENFKNYNTKENLVLKTLLKILYDLLRDNNSIAYKKYRNYDSTMINKVYIKNIYLSRVDTKNFNISDRILNDVCKSRNSLYRESAELLKKYRKIMNLNEKEIKNLLKNTFIDIANESTLFELFWIFKILKGSADGKLLHVIDGGNNKVAEWEDNQRKYAIYHNSIGSGNISFRVHRDEVRDVDNLYIKKELSVVDKTNEIAQQLFTGIKDRYIDLYNGRPDILLEIRNRDTEKLEKIIIGEVKYTNKRDYVIEGLKELLEYMELIKTGHKGCFEYVSELENKIDIEGLLFVDNIELNKDKLSEIKVFTMLDDKEKNIDLGLNDYKIKYKETLESLSYHK